LQTKAGLAAVAAYQAASARVLDQERAATVRRLAQRLQLALGQVADPTDQIEARDAAGFSP
jgi:hypothetical protein